jgi:hypothetical protein
MRNWRTWAFLGVVVWIVCVGFWVTQPMTVTVTVGLNPDGSAKTATVECDSPLSGNTDPTSALPDLAAGESFSEAPCDRPITSGRTLFALDVVLAVVALLLIALVRRRHDPEPTGTTGLSQATPVTN